MDLIKIGEWMFVLGAALIVFLIFCLIKRSDIYCYKCGKNVLENKTNSGCVCFQCPRCHAMLVDKKPSDKTYAAIPYRFWDPRRILVLAGYYLNIPS